MSRWLVAHRAAALSPSRRLSSVALAALVAAVTIVYDAQPVTASDPERLRSEIRFREQFGFRSDEAYVSQVIAAAGNGPVPLTDAEAAEMERRFVMQEQMTPLEVLASALPDFAGMWIDQPGGGVITVAFTSGADAQRSVLEPLIPQGATLTVIEVPHSLHALEELEQRIEIDDRQLLRSRGIELSYVAVDVSENRVRLGVIGLTATDDAELHSRYGETVMVEPSNPVLTGCVSREDCYGPPLRAGISGSPLNTAYRNRCSVAFMIRSGSLYQWLTAGHCAQETQVGVPWYNGAHPNRQIGTIRFSCWPDCLNADAARAGDIAPEYASNAVYLMGGQPPRSVYGVQALNVENEGDMTCLNARRHEGWRCGYFEFVDRIDWGWDSQCQCYVWFEEQRFATYDHMYGDSGGAVHSYSRPGDFAVLAMGVHSGCTNLNLQTDVCEGLSVYSHISHVTAQLGGVTVCTLANPCP